MSASQPPIPASHPFRRTRGKFLAALLCAVSALAMLDAPASNASITVASSVSDPNAIGEFVPLQGRVLADTSMTANQWRNVPIAGQLGVPAGTEAVAVVFTTVNAAAGGYLNATPKGVAPTTPFSYLNFSAGQTQSNSAILRLSSDGFVSVATTAATTLRIDLQGYYRKGTAGGFEPVTPTRRADTRSSAYGIPAGRISATSPRALPVGPTAGFNVAGSPVSVYANLTVVGATSSGSFRVRAPGSAWSTTEYAYSPEVTSVAAAVPLDSAGNIEVLPSVGSLDLVVDVVGYYTRLSDEAAAYVPAVKRVASATTIGANATRAFQVSDLNLDASAVPLAAALHFAVVPSTTGGYINTWMADEEEPVTAALQYANKTVSNSAIVALSWDGRISVSNHGSSTITVVIDLQGWFPYTQECDPTAVDTTCAESTNTKPVQSYPIVAGESRPAAYDRILPEGHRSLPYCAGFELRDKTITYPPDPIMTPKLPTGVNFRITAFGSSIRRYLGTVGVGSLDVYIGDDYEHRGPYNYNASKYRGIRTEMLRGSWRWLSGVTYEPIQVRAFLLNNAGRAKCKSYYDIAHPNAMIPS